jgi:hypothetical protein
MELQSARKNAPRKYGFLKEHSTLVEGFAEKKVPPSFFLGRAK